MLEWPRCEGGRRSQWPRCEGGRRSQWPRCDKIRQSQKHCNLKLLSFQGEELYSELHQWRCPGLMADSLSGRPGGTIADNQFFFGTSARRSGPWRQRSGPWRQRSGPWQQRSGPWQQRSGPWQQRSGPWQQRKAWKKSHYTNITLSTNYNPFSEEINISSLAH